MSTPLSLQGEGSPEGAGEGLKFYFVAIIFLKASISDFGADTI
jgi:hypothetical protein